MNDNNFIDLLNRVLSQAFSYEQKKALYLAAKLRLMGRRPDGGPEKRGQNDNRRSTPDN